MRLNFDVAEMVSFSVQRKNDLNAIETSGEPETIRRSSVPVTMATPALGFIGMARFAPGFELLEKDVFELREGVTTAAETEIIARPKNDWF